MKRLLVVGGVAVVALTCVRLGLWQWERHRTRAARNAVTTERMAAPLGAVDVAWADSAAFRRVTATGRFDFSRQVVELGRAVRGVPAAYVVTPLRLVDGRAILVERGWTPSPDARSVVLERLSEPESTVVTGILVRLDGGAEPATAGWPLYLRRADPSALAGRYPYPLAPLVLRRMVMPAGAPTELCPTPLPEITAGPHLAYMVQWFVFAAIAVIGPVVLGKVRNPNRVVESEFEPPVARY